MSGKSNEVLIHVKDGVSLWEKNGSFGNFLVSECMVSSGMKNNISAGQNYQIRNGGSITFYADRHKTDQVAEWWKSRIPADHNTFDKNPGALNFAVIGNLELNVTGGIFGNEKYVIRTEGIAMAQGHTASRNNWWFGAKDCVRTINGKNYIAGQVLNILNHIQGTGSLNRITLIGKITGTDKTVVYEVDRSENGNTVNTLGFYFHEIIGSNNADWCSRYFSDREETRLYEMILPASHDAGMSSNKHQDELSQLVHVTGTIKAQKFSVYNQLICGSRYFDLRPDFDHNELVTYHRTAWLYQGTAWLGANGQSIEEILDQTARFLDEHSTEFAIHKFSHFRNDNGHNGEYTYQRLLKLLKAEKYKKYLLISENDTDLHQLTYKQLKGKMILVTANQPADPANGIYSYCDAAGPSNCHGNNTLYVYDKYSDTMDCDTMAADQVKKWHENSGHNDNYLFLLSWTLTPKFKPFSDILIEDLAAKAADILRSALKTETEDKGTPLPSLVLLDYIDENLCSEIIKYNSPSAAAEYISDIKFVSASKEKTASGLRPDGYNLIKNDLNAGAGGDFIYLCYKTTTNPDEAITNIVMDRSGKSQSYSKITAECKGINAEYVRNETDLNKGAGGDFIYMLTTRDKRYQPLRRIDVAFDTPDSISGEAVCWKNSSEPADLNKNAKGKFIYLVMNR